MIDLDLWKKYRKAISEHNIAAYEEYNRDCERLSKSIDEEIEKYDKRSSIGKLISPRPVPYIQLPPPPLILESSVEGFLDWMARRESDS